MKDAPERPDEKSGVDVINISAIPVAGIGGLGLVVMAAVVAWSFPGIRLMMALAAVIGVLLAAALILWRRREGPLSSSGLHGGATNILDIDQRPRIEQVDEGRPPVRRREQMPGEPSWHISCG